MNRIAAQQCRALFQIVIDLAFANHNGSQTQHIAPASLINQNSRHQSTYATKAIEHHILGLGQRLDIGADNIFELVGDKLITAATIANALKLDHHLAQINMRWPESADGQLLRS